MKLSCIHGLLPLSFIGSRRNTLPLPAYAFSVIARLSSSPKSPSLNAKFTNALRQTNTTGITRKSSELTDAAIASGLNASLDRELKGIGVTGLKLGIDLHGQKGQGRQQLRLDMARPHVRAKASQILSEGEQRAISIACFLAETNLVSQTTSG